MAGGQAALRGTHRDHATILINRSELIVPGTSVSIEEGFLHKVFDVVWTALTVLWFAQIFPKHLAATNPDRYLHYLRRSLFPVVEVVRRIGVSPLRLSAGVGHARAPVS